MLSICELFFQLLLVRDTTAFKPTVVGTSIDMGADVKVLSFGDPDPHDTNPTTQHILLSYVINVCVQLAISNIFIYMYHFVLYQGKLCKYGVKFWSSVTNQNL
jgi:hypothetical protein